MRALAGMLLACLTVSGAHAQSDAETLRRLEECFALTRVADAICENSLRIDDARLDCLKKSRDAQKECLDHMRMGPSAAVPTGAPPVAPATTSSAPPVAAATTSSDGWTIGEKTSPVDFSPLLVAELRPVTAAPNGAPAVLTLRCRGARTEISVRAQGTWRPSRAGDVDVALQTDGKEAVHLRWLLSQDGRTASLPQDAAETVRTWRDSRVSIAITDATGSGGASIFDLSGLETVRARLAAACHWSPSRTEARGREP
jgi:hypothetical protein